MTTGSRVPFVWSVIALLLSLNAPSLNGSGLTIARYQLVGVTSPKRGLFDDTYRASITNSGLAVRNVSATIASVSPVFDIVDAALSFGNVPAGATVVAGDTFTIRHTQKAAVNLSMLRWTIQATPVDNLPVAKAGSDQRVAVLTTVRLDGTQSSDPDGHRLTFAWSFASRPNGSQATLSNPSGLHPTFLVDVPGRYVVSLVVHDGTLSSAPDTVMFTAAGDEPVANAGPDQVVATGATVHLGQDGVLLPSLTYRWAFVSKPSGSAAALSNATSSSPTFAADVPGAYVVQLVVSNGPVNSAPDTVTISAARSLAFSPNALALVPGAIGVLTISIPVADANDRPVMLVSSDPNVATVPAAVTIPAGQTSAPFNVTAGTTNGGAIVTASAYDATTTKAVVAVGSHLVQWTQDANGSWDVPANWSGGAVPAGGDVVVIDRPTGNFVVTVPTTTAAVRSLYATEQMVVTGSLVIAGTGTLDGGLSLSGTITGSGAVTLGAPGNWISGTVSLAGGLDVGFGQTLTLTTGNTHSLVNTSLHNHGTVTWTAGSLFSQGESAVVNEIDGVWDVQGDLSVTGDTCGVQTFTNAGLLRKTAGPGTLTLGGACATYVNTGTVEVQSGVASAQRPLDNSGHLTVAAGTTFLLDQVTLQTGSTFSGAGTLHMNGTTTVTGDLMLTVPTLLSATVTGSGALRVATSMTWSAGTVSLAGGLQVGGLAVGAAFPASHPRIGTLTLPTGNGAHYLVNTSLHNLGDVTWTSGLIFFQGNSAVVNESDGKWDAQGDLTIASNGCGGAQTFTNAGLMRKTAGTGALTLTGCATYANTGTVEVQSGVVIVGSSLGNSGHLTVAAGATFLLDHVTLQTGSTFSGAGTLHMNGTTAVTGDLMLTVPTLLSATVTGSGALHLAAPMMWSAGTVTLAGGLDVAAGQTLTVSTTGQHVLGSNSLNTSLHNHGTVAWTGGAIYLQSSTTLVNESDGLWDIQTAGEISSSSCGTPSFTNAGTLRKSGTLGALTVSACVTLTNTGVISLRLGGTGAGQFDRLTAGQVTLGGTLDVQLVNGFTPSPGNSFDVISYSSRTGTFAVVNGNGTIYSTAYGPAAVTLTAPSTPFGVFQNEILITGMNLPTAIKFLPNGDMLILELGGKIWKVPAGTTQVNPTPVLTLTNIGTLNGQQGLMDLTLDPNFGINHYYYVFYTLGSPNRDRASRFTANADFSGTIAGSELVLYQDPGAASSEHHGGALSFSGDGKLYITTGEHFGSEDAQDLSSPRGKLLRINSDGTVPADNPFYDGAGPNYDAIWAIGLRNPFRAFYDAISDRLLIGDVGGNDYSTAQEEVHLGARGANYGWPICEGFSCGSNPTYTSPLFAYPHNGRDASITGGFVYRGSQFPASYYGSYFYADYAQNWIRRLTFDASGIVNGDFPFEPPDGTPDGPYGDIVYLAQGPDGALYYVDLGYSDTTGQTGLSKIRRIRFISTDQPPTAAASAQPTEGRAPLSVSFSSDGSADPEGQPLTFSWDFGDGTTSTAANPAHVYTGDGRYTVRLSVSDGTNSTLAAPLAISVGNRPVPTMISPQDGLFFRAGDVLTFAGDALDVEDGVLPPSAFTWNIDFLHAGHVHPGLPQAGTKTGTFTIPTTGHDFSGNTRYRITLTVTDSSGLQSAQSVLIYPQKVNVTFDSAPSSLVLTLDGIAHVTPFVYDTLVGFVHTIDAPNQVVGANLYTFASWSDGGGQSHAITIPETGTALLATYTVTSNPLPSGLVAGYRFSEGSGTTTADLSGNNHTGTLVGNPLWATGRYGGGLSFQGVNYVDLGNAASLQMTGSMTLTAWINISAHPVDDGAIMAKLGPAGWQLKTSPDTGPRTAAIQISADGSDAIQRYSGTVLTTDTWYHVAGVYDAAARTLSIYVNGVLDNGVLSGTVPAAQYNAPFNVNIAQRTGEPVTFNFLGTIDEAHVFNRALTAAEIQTDMNTPR